MFVGPVIRFLLDLPGVPTTKFSLRVPFARKHKLDGQHYWTIGKRGYLVHKIRSLIEKEFEVVKDFSLFENTYHHFYVGKTKSVI